jgi:hypothetical protein
MDEYESALAEAAEAGFVLHPVSTETIHVLGHLEGPSGGARLVLWKQPAQPHQAAHMVRQFVARTLERLAS